MSGFVRTAETKVLRDPVHGYIHVDYQIVWDCINSQWFQRLRRIRQLGGAYMVYHTAEHSRFSHSLGVYEVVRRMVSEVPDIAHALNEKEKVTVMLAGLLHDIGHGPYSHAFEPVSTLSHEEYSCRIIEEDPQLSGLLNRCRRGLAKEVADVIRHQSANPLLTQLISGQLDADRMDYLLRDAYFTGTKYGEFDLERILRTMRVADGKIVVKQSGVQAVENYIMARYHMYWQVYYHPVARSYECMLSSLFLRIRDQKLHHEPGIVPLFEPLTEHRSLSLEEYFPLDENACGYGFACLKNGSDPVAADLAGRLLDRRLFEYQDRDPQSERQIRRKLKENGWDPRYYFCTDDVHQNPYTPYKGLGEEAIWILTDSGKIRELSNASVIVKSLTHGESRSDNKVFYPKMQ
jgi:HD superfamily phosphohydrolase